MKRLIILIIAAAVGISGCARGGAEVGVGDLNDDEIESAAWENSEIEAEIRAAEHLAGYEPTGDFACDGGDALYFVTQAYAHRMIIRYDKSGKIGAPLCKIPGCTHDEPGCGANVDSGAGLTYRDGRLYWMEVGADGAVIFCEDVESGVRAAIKTLPGITYPAVYDAVFWDGKAIYYAADLVGDDAAVHIGIADLNGGEDTEIFNKDNDYPELKMPINIDIRVIDRDIYITSFNFLDRSDPDSDIEAAVYKYEISSGKISEILSVSSENGDIPRAGSVKLITKNYLYFMSSETRKICRFDIAKKTVEELFDFSEYGSTYGFAGGEIRDFRIFGDICCALSVRDGATVLAAKNLAGELIFETDLSGFFDGEGGHPSVWIAGRDPENIYVCYTFQDAGYTYQLNETVAVSAGAGEAEILCCNRSSLLKGWD